MVDICRTHERYENVSNALLINPLAKQRLNVSRRRKNYRVMLRLRKLNARAWTEFVFLKTDFSDHLW
jgi:hypothetical protein